MNARVPRVSASLLENRELSPRSVAILNDTVCEFFAN